MDNDTARGRDDAHTSWHPAFLEAFKAELDRYGDILEYTPEYQLTKEPLRIDVVVVKKRKNVPIEKNIAAIFRGHNIIEFKSPSDYISLEDFYKVYAYACLYATVGPETAGERSDLTITFVASHYPRKVAEHLEQVRRCAVEKTSCGIYTVKGDPIPIQIIDTRELPEEENIWLGKLDNRLDRDAARKILCELDRLDKAAHMSAYIDALYNANFEVIEEVSGMSDMAAILDKTFENAGGFMTRKMNQARSEGRKEGEEKGKEEGKKEGKEEGKEEGKKEGKEEGKREIARNMKANKVPASQISAYTGLSEEQITKL